MSKLVIVESPAKAKTIKKYLGEDYNVIASMGHIRDLPKAQMGVDIEDNFKPRYINIPGKSKLIRELKTAAAESEMVYLATDPDREGEAISWHLAHILKLDTAQQNRVTFGEITKKGVTEGMANKRTIDEDLINAQQARRILDRIVGYKLSPFLWEKIKGGLSAGRVQSVAVKLIVDRHREIESFVPQEYWNIDATLAAGSKKFKARYYGTNGEKVAVDNETQAMKIKASSENQPFEIAKITKGNRKRLPAPPFITSSLQQEASRRLGFTASRTMRAAQTLYEGVEVAGYGQLGLITYMRTDSLRVSDEAIFAAKAFIKEKFGEQYVPNYKRTYKQKNNAQDAHEAIRPTNVNITPEAANASLSGDVAKLYKLIWERFVASQMADCLQETVAVDINCGNHLYKANGYTVLFEGFTALYEEQTDEKKEKESALPPLEEDTKLKLKEIEAAQKFTQPPGEYTEATLIKALEENGIGRPSTYAPIIYTITEKAYVERDGKKLVPTALGTTINDLLEAQFSNIVNVKFSADMETSLDEIEEGKKEWTAVLSDFYSDFSKDLEKAQADMEGKKVKVPDEVTDEICELCGKPMVIKTGKFGKFLACSGFPDCKNTKRIIRYAKGSCVKCGGKMLVLTSKRGRVFYACEDNTNCKFITWEEPTDKVCAACGKSLYKKAGKAAKPHCINESCKDYKPTVTRKSSKKGKTADEG
ncbi:MAG: type I DNA topoisomerase [Oscillospiraceae bacterium]|nr:type I DNA topoisomerase [Oscillospiraceae bacterium]